MYMLIKTRNYLKHRLIGNPLLCYFMGSQYGQGRTIHPKAISIMHLIAINIIPTLLSIHLYNKTAFISNKGQTIILPYTLTSYTDGPRLSAGSAKKGLTEPSTEPFIWNGLDSSRSKQQQERVVIFWRKVR